ncbi:hypothetical protein GE09DRAFT_480239 [Coniochaeta sp. 2T2.1]|nr:hypothetical protein GE09DRAFT_480239 [Coniochaeta sp. 2T2.1]
MVRERRTRRSGNSTNIILGGHRSRRSLPLGVSKASRAGVPFCSRGGARTCSVAVSTCRKQCRSLTPSSSSPRRSNKSIPPRPGLLFILVWACKQSTSDRRNQAKQLDRMDKWHQVRASSRPQRHQTQTGRVSSSMLQSKLSIRQPVGYYVIKTLHLEHIRTSALLIFRHCSRSSSAAVICIIRRLLFLVCPSCRIIWKML